MLDVVAGDVTTQFVRRAQMVGSWCAGYSVDRRGTDVEPRVGSGTRPGPALADPPDVAGEAVERGHFDTKVAPGLGRASIPGRRPPLSRHRGVSREPHQLLGVWE